MHMSAFCEIILCDIYIYIYDRVSRINKNDRSASDLIKLSVFQLHVIEMQLLEHQCTNVHVYICVC